MLKSKIITICAILAVMTPAVGVHAAPTLVDDPVFGTDSVIRDQSILMDFLCLRFTEPYSYNQVLAELGPGGIFEGWEVASEADLLLLGSSANIVHGSTDPAMLARAEELRDWFGHIHLTTTHEVCRGLILDPGPPGTQAAFTIGRRFNVTPWEVDFRISGYAGPDAVHESTYLVRPIPPQKDRSFLIGTWVNIDQSSGGIAAFAIYEDQAGDLFIYTLGQCTPSPCVWGTVPCIDYIGNVWSNLSTGFMAFYDFGILETWMAATRLDYPEFPLLQVTDFNFFFDSQYDYWNSDIFVRIN